MTKPVPNPAPTTLYGYDKCDTCRKAEKALRARGITFDKVPLFETPPDAATFRTWLSTSGLPTKKWINVAGESYRALLAARGKEAVAALGVDDLAALFAADGRLVKRPILLHEGRLHVGYDQAVYAALEPSR